MSPASVMKLIAEVGLDMGKWPTEKHFASWLRLCPNNRITGGRIHSGKTLPSKNVAAEVFRKCAENLARSQTFYGALYRRMRARRGGSYAVVVVAHRLAKIFYRTLKNRRPYVDLGAQHFDATNKERQLKAALKRIKALGYEAMVQEAVLTPA
jgi:transposase